MGGYGSGRRFGSVKTTVEDCLVLSSSKLMRDRILRSHLRQSCTLTWSNTRTGEKLSSIGFDPDTHDDFGSARLHYTCTRTSEPVDYRVCVTTTPLPWGGLRWWFICPLNVEGRSCGRRVGKLYLPPGAKYFGCRGCYGLTYTSCRESHRFDGLFAMLASDSGADVAAVRRALRS